MAGIGMSRQNDVLPVILLDYIYAKYHLSKMFRFAQKKKTKNIDLRQKTDRQVCQVHRCTACEYRAHKHFKNLVNFLFC